MSQSLSAIYLHLVFSTKNRLAYLRDDAFREAMFHYIGGITNTLNCPVLRVGGFEDHVHVLARFSRSITISEWVKEIKRVSSTWAKDDKSQDHFSWQSGYGCFSVSASKVNSVISYIENQPTHHLTASFQDEFREFLQKYGLEWNEQYVWN